MDNTNRRGARELAQRSITAALSSVWCIPGPKNKLLALSSFITPPLGLPAPKADSLGSFTSITRSTPYAAAGANVCRGRGICLKSAGNATHQRWEAITQPIDKIDCRIRQDTIFSMFQFHLKG